MIAVVMFCVTQGNAQYTKVFNEASGATRASTKTATDAGSNALTKVSGNTASTAAKSASGSVTTTGTKARTYTGNSTGHSGFGRTNISTTGSQTAPTSNAARRAAMRSEGIPTSQQPSKQSRSKSGMEYQYKRPKDGGGTQTKAVQDQTLDYNHKNKPHWEAGKTKVDDKGNVQTNQHGRAKLSNNKSKVEYPNKKKQ